MSIKVKSATKMCKAFSYPFNKQLRSRGTLIYLVTIVDALIHPVPGTNPSELNERRARCIFVVIQPNEVL
jgi:hypothetical protein